MLIVDHVPAGPPYLVGVAPAVCHTAIPTRAATRKCWRQPRRDEPRTPQISDSGDTEDRTANQSATEMAPNLDTTPRLPGLLHSHCSASEESSNRNCSDSGIPEKGLPSTPAVRSRLNSLCVLIVILATLARPSSAICPQVCVCDTNTLRASCEDAGLDVVPFQLNPEAKTINLRGNRISTLEYSLSFYTHLQSLDISENRIQSLGSKNFEQLDRLVNLNMSGNEISSFGKDAFKGLRSLRVLDLSDNIIDSLARDMFTDMHDLWELHLSGNRLDSIADGVFHALVNLRVLRLGNNQLLSVPTAALVRLSSLRVLTLNENLIESVEDNAFPNLKELTELTLDSNVISDIQADAFKSLTSLERLDLSNNNLTSVPATQLSRLGNLNVLDISGNMFSHIGPVAFYALVELRVLRLNTLIRLTRVDVRAFSDNKRLESVSMERNPLLTSLPTRLFQGNPLLSRVSVRGSAITSLEAAHFPLDRLQVLDVADVPLICNCSLLWLWLLCREQRQHMITLNETVAAASAAAVDGTTTTPPSTVSPGPSALSTPELHPIVNLDGIRCAGPPDLKGFSLVNVPETEVRCEATWMAVVMVTLVVLILFGATCTILFFLSTGRWCGHDKEASDVSTDSFATQHTGIHSNHLKHHGSLPPPAPLLPGGQVMMMGPDMKVEPTYATIGVGNGRPNFLDEYKKEQDHLVNDFAYQRALKGWDSSFNGGHHTHSMGRPNHHDAVRHHNGAGNYGTYQNHYSMAIDMTKKAPHIVYV